MGIFNDNKKTDKDHQAQTEEKSMKDLYTTGGDLKKKNSKKVSDRAYRILLKPLITEKATNLGSLNQYVFLVETGANKIEVAKAVQEVYGLKPLSVKIINMKGKAVSRGRISGRRKDFKKAVISLKKGQSISVYEGV